MSGNNRKFLFIYFVFFKENKFTLIIFLTFFSLKFFRPTNLKNVDIGDLTWEQKEKVLRLLFAKMNGFAAR